MRLLFVRGALITLLAGFAFLAQTSRMPAPPAQSWTTSAPRAKQAAEAKHIRSDSPDDATIARCTPLYARGLYTPITTDSHTLIMDDGTEATLPNDGWQTPATKNWQLAAKRLRTCLNHRP